MGSFCYLVAAAHDDAEVKADGKVRVRVLNKDQYFLVPVENAGFFVHYKDGDRHRMLQPGKDVNGSAKLHH